MKRPCLILILFTNIMVSCSSEYPCTGEDNLVMPKPLYLSLHDQYTGSNLIFGDSAIYSSDSVQIMDLRYSVFHPIAYDTMRKAIEVDIVPSLYEENRTYHLKFSENRIDTITVHYKDIGICGDAIVVYTSYSFSFDYNKINICAECEWDKVYSILR